MYISKPICFADNQFDLVVGYFNPCVAQIEVDRVKNTLLVTLDFSLKKLESGYSAMACLPEPMLQISFRLLNIS